MPAPYTTMRYLFVIERARRNVAGYFPDVPGYAATAKTVEDLIALAHEGIAFHLEEESRPPRPHSLQWHLGKGGLKLAPTDLVTWIEYARDSRMVSA
jgi:predicted RNase H-like HicB family nuclease